MTNYTLTTILFILIIVIQIQKALQKANGDYPKPLNASEFCTGERPLAKSNHFLTMVTANTRYYDDDKKNYTIDVNFTAKSPTVLLLNGNNRIIWNIKVKQPKLLKAIVITGPYSQKINLDSGNAPIYNAKNTGKCLEEYLHPISKEYSPFLVRYINLPMIEHVYDNGKNTVYLTEDGHSNRLSIRSIHEPNNLKELMTNPKNPSYVHLRGLDGIQQAVKLGLIRPATEEDSKAYVTAYRQMLKREKISPNFGKWVSGYHDSEQKNRYVILYPFLLPTDIDPLFMPTFYLTKGVPYPRGDIEYSAIYDLNDGTCVGLQCKRPP